MRIVLTPEAVSDIVAAIAYYAGVDQRLSGGFIDDVDAVLARIAIFPKGDVRVEGFDGLRRARMRQFPKGIFYQQTQTDDLLAVRLLHARAKRRSTGRLGTQGTSTRSVPVTDRLTGHVAS